MNRLLFLATGLLALGTVSTFAQNLPTGGEVVAGTAGIVTSSDQMRVDQATDKAIINWNTFDIGEGYRVVFVQPSESSVTLNRVTGGKPSEVLGRLDANGTVMLVNPDGILFGRNSVVDVGSLVATTHDLVDGDFLAGDYDFSLAGNPSASIINLGAITARDSGIAALVAPGVRNEGLIQARLGKVALASGNGFSLDLYGDSLIKLAVDDEILSEVIDLSTGKPLRTHVDNQGTLSADGGSVALTAVTARRVVDQVINNEGLIEATTVGTRNGKIVLGAATATTKTPQSPDQKVLVSGDLIATGDYAGEFGGKVLITGELLRLTHANIDASGAAGGGTVLVGGDYLGGRAPDAMMAFLGIEREAQALPTASTLWMDKDSSIDVSATTSGKGGKLVLWSEDGTLFLGTLAANGGVYGGDGGFIEVSGRKGLAIGGLLSATSQGGEAGTVLFDPLVVEIVPYDGVFPSDPSLEFLSSLITADEEYRDEDGFFPGGYFLLNGNGNRMGAHTTIAAPLIEYLLKFANVIIYQDPSFYDPDLEIEGFDSARIVVNSAIAMPSSDRSLTFAVTGPVNMQLNDIIDMAGSLGSLQFFNFGGDATLTVGAGGKIVGNAKSIIFDGMSAVGTEEAPLPIEVVDDTDATKKTYEACVYKGVCNDKGTKIATSGINPSNVDNIHLKIISPLDVATAVPTKYQVFVTSNGVTKKYDVDLAALGAIEPASGPASNTANDGFYINGVNVGAKAVKDRRLGSQRFADISDDVLKHAVDLWLNLLGANEVVQFVIGNAVENQVKQAKANRQDAYQTEPSSENMTDYERYVKRTTEAAAWANQ